MTKGYSYLIFGLLCLILSKGVDAQTDIIGNDAYGQIFDVLYDQNQEDVLYARTVGSHIVKTEDGGQNWDVLYSDPMDIISRVEELELINDGEVLSFTVLAEGTDYNSINLMDLETGEIIKQFYCPNDDQSDILIESYAISSQNNDVAVMHTTYTNASWALTSEVFYTSDGGETWESIYLSTDNNSITINNVAIAPNDDQKVFLMRGGAPTETVGGLLVSSDAGQTWEEKIPGYTYSPIAFNPTDANDILVGTFYAGNFEHVENVYRSLDGGDSWAIVPIDWTDMSTNSIQGITFNPTDPTKIMVLEENEIAVTTDNGSTWVNHVYPQIDPEDYYYGLSASYNPFEDDQVVISANYYPFISDDNGTTLAKLQNPFINSTGRISHYSNDEVSNLYYGLRSGWMLRDLETDQETPYAMMPLDGFGFNSTGAFADPVVPGRVFLGTNAFMGASVSVSADHGNDFVLAYSTFVANIYDVATSASNPNITYLSLGNSLVRLDLTDFDNITSTDIATPEPVDFTEIAYSLMVDVDDSDLLTMAFGKKLYRSENAGADWVLLAEFDELTEVDDAIMTIERNPLNMGEIAIGTTRGIYVSEDEGENWNIIYDGNPVYNVSFSPFNEGHIVGVTHYMEGNSYLPNSYASIAYSMNDGDTWETVAPEALHYIFHGNSSAIQFYEQSAEVYFGAFDLGLVRHTIDMNTVGLFDSPAQSEVLVYPNPAVDHLFIQDKENLAQVRIYNISGQLVMASRTNKNRFDVSTLTEGIYTIQIESTDGTVSVQKFVKH